MKFKKLSKLVGLTTMATVLLAGCASSTQDKKDTSSSTGKEINVDVFQFKVEFKDEFEKLAKEYTKKHPDVKINITTVGGGGDYGAALKSKFQSGNEPVIFNIGGPQDVKDWKEKLENLSDTELAKQALEKTLTSVKDGDKLYGLPFNQEGYGFIYNKEIFKKAGIDATKLTTFESLSKAVSELDSKKSELGIDAVFALPAKEAWVTGLHLSNIFLSPEFDGDVNKVYNATTLDFKHKKQFKDVLDLQNKFSVQPTNSLDYSQQVEQLFSTGKVAIIQQGNWVFNSIKEIDEKLAENIGIIPIPVENVIEDKLPVGVPMYWAVNSTKDDATKKAAKDFLTWMYTSEEGKDYVMTKFKFIPAYKGYDDSKIQDPLSKTIYNYSKEGKTLNWVFMGYPSGWGINTLGTGLQKYVAGQAQFDDVLKDSKEAFEKARK